MKTSKSNYLKKMSLFKNKNEQAQNVLSEDMLFAFITEEMM